MRVSRWDIDSVDGPAIRLQDHPNRRLFLRQAALGVGGAAGYLAGPVRGQGASTLAASGVIGLTTGGLNFQRRRGELTLRSLPAFVRDELGLQLIDLNSHWLEGYETSYLQQVRGIAQEAGCHFTNLKVNHQYGDLYSHDPYERQRALASARRLVDVARQLGTRWIRFTLPSRQALGSAMNPRPHRELAAYAQQHGLQLLVENLGWLSQDTNGIPLMVTRIGHNAAACPDNGNWTEGLRYEGLSKAFPGAASCDFKALEMEPNFAHPAYDLARCFQIGWDAGFRGPWIIEHSNERTSEFVRETVHLRDRLLHWIGSRTEQR